MHSKLLVNHPLVFRRALLFISCLTVLQLLDHEVHAREQVPLLIEMRKADLALDKAIESGDPQLGNFIIKKQCASCTMGVYMFNFPLYAQPCIFID